MVLQITTSETSSESEDSLSDKHDDQNICRDFLRNVCKRGKHCKYRHPASIDAVNVDRSVRFTFCHDFQNSGCRRSNCKFIHCTRDEEDMYKETNHLPEHVLQSSGLKLVNSDFYLSEGEVPVCRDFLKGSCKRNSKCKYHHYSNLDYENTQIKSNSCFFDESSHIFNLESKADCYCNSTDEQKLSSYIIPLKRPCLEVQKVENGMNSTLATFKYSSAVDFNLLQEENSILRQKIKELEKRVSDLYATNEVLLDQNARLRLNRSNIITHQHPPIVTVSQVVTPTVTPTVRSTLSGTVAVINTTLPSMNAITIKNNDMMVNASSLPTRIAQGIPSHCSTLNAPVTVQAQALIPVSINVETISRPVQHNMSIMSHNFTPTVATCNFTPTVATCNFTPTVATCNFSQDLISKPSSHMVSYPIFSNKQISGNRR